MAGFIQHYAVDLGSTTLRVYSSRAREVRCTPNVAVLDQRGGIRARGVRALALQGRTPAGLEVVHPVARGVVTDQAVAVRLLREALWESAPVHVWASARASVCVSDESTPVERQALLAVCQEAGLRAVQLVPASLAAVAGAGVEVRDTSGALVVDVGTENVTAALISAASVVLARSIPQGGAAVDRRLVRHLYDEHDFAVSPAEAERAKIELGSLPGKGATVTVKGRELDRGLPRTLTLSAGDLAPALEEVARRHRRADPVGADRRPGGAGARRLRARGGALRRGLAAARAGAAGPPPGPAPGAHPEPAWRDRRHGRLAADALGPLPRPGDGAAPLLAHGVAHRCPHRRGRDRARERLNHARTAARWPERPPEGLQHAISDAQSLPARAGRR
ncbi:hypothetical protein GXW82_18210 [Streptacidiphilus sp. 4-A2]|nr:hypothetical protein [Streptacidiphilus sp. 4-A2]